MKITTELTHMPDDLGGVVLFVFASVELGKVVIMS